VLWNRQVPDTYTNAVLHTLVDAHQTWLQCPGLRIDAPCREQERVPLSIARNTLMSDQPHDSICQALHMHTLFALSKAISGILSSLRANDTILLSELLPQQCPATTYICSSFQKHLFPIFTHFLTANKRPLTHHILQSQHLDQSPIKAILSVP
jgi:hypothetical protein